MTPKKKYAANVWGGVCLVEGLKEDFPFILLTKKMYKTLEKFWRQPLGLLYRFAVFASFKNLRLFGSCARSYKYIVFRVSEFHVRR